MQLRTIRQRSFALFFTGCFVGFPCIGLHAQVRTPRDSAQEFLGSFEQMFEQFANTPLGPLFGKLTPEQKQQIQSIAVSPQEESQFGQRVLDAYLKQLKNSAVEVSNQGKEIAYLKELTKRIKPLMTNSQRYRQFDIRLIERPEMDAFSIPGGRLLITRGMLDQGASEATLVGVLAHELSHLDHGHQLLPLKQSKLSRQPLDFSDHMLWVAMIARPAWPEQESEADADATRWMMELGYDPRELVKLLNRWAQDREQTAPWLQMVPGFVKSHPDAERRAQSVAALADQLKPKYPGSNFIGVENLKQRKPR